MTASGSSIVLRPYQQEAVKAVSERFHAGDTATLLVVCTGAGKTTIFGRIARYYTDAGMRVLVLAHREELIAQAAARLSAMCGVEASVEKAEREYDFESPLCVASVQTLQGERLARIPKGWFDLTIIDEAHHSVAESYANVIAATVGFTGRLLGVTATADRADKKGLSEVYDSIAYEYPLERAVAEGYLCPIEARCIPLSIDLRKVKVSHGDYQASGLGSALEPYLDEIAAAMAEHCAGRKTVCFLPLVSTAERMADALNRAGLSAVAASGYDDSATRARKKEAFERGEYDVLCNSMLYSEGWDCPPVDCIAVLRPTKSRGLFTQMVGRGTRLSPETGKKNLLLLDFLWMTDKHDLCRPATLLGKSGRTAELMEGQSGDLMELAEQAERDVVAEREAALARELEASRRKKAKLVNPLQYATSIMELDLVDYSPTFAWEGEKPSEKQLAAIERFGVDASAIATKGEACQYMDALTRRADLGLATPKQIACLERRGFMHVGTWSKRAASAMIARLASGGWRTPRGIDPKTYEPER